MSEDPSWQYEPTSESAKPPAQTADAREGIKHESWCSTLQECDCGAAEQQEGK